MLKKNILKNPLLICLHAYLLTCLFIVFLIPSKVLAADATPVTLPETPPAPSAQGITLTQFLQTFYIYLSRFTLLASFLMIVLAIYVYMTSSGDTKKIGKAREYLTSAIIGMVAVAFAYTFFEILNPNILSLGK